MPTRNMVKTAFPQKKLSAAGSDSSSTNGETTSNTASANANSKIDTGMQRTSDQSSALASEVLRQLGLLEQGAGVEKQAVPAQNDPRPAGAAAAAVKNELQNATRSADTNGNVDASSGRNRSSESTLQSDVEDERGFIDADAEVADAVKQVTKAQIPNPINGTETNVLSAASPTDATSSYLVSPSSDEKPAASSDKQDRDDWDYTVCGNITRDGKACFRRGYCPYHCGLGKIGVKRELLLAVPACGAINRYGQPCKRRGDCPHHRPNGNAASGAAAQGSTQSTALAGVARAPWTGSPSYHMPAQVSHPSMSQALQQYPQLWSLGAPIVPQPVMPFPALSSFPSHSSFPVPARQPISRSADDRDIQDIPASFITARGFIQLPIPAARLPGAMASDSLATYPSDLQLTLPAKRRSEAKPSSPP